MSMQGGNSSVFLVTDKIEGFKKKINFWKKRVKDKQLDMLPLLSNTLESISHVDISGQIPLHWHNYYESLISTFQRIHVLKIYGL